MSINREITRLKRANRISRVRIRNTELYKMYNEGLLTKDEYKKFKANSDKIVK